jgi:hypothetical protein
MSPRAYLPFRGSGSGGFLVCSVLPCFVGYVLPVRVLHRRFEAGQAPSAARARTLDPARLPGGIDRELVRVLHQRPSA